jgi:oligopeptide transport system substrate-binding protein
MDMPRARKESDGEDYDNKFACKLVLERNAYYMRDVEDDDIDEYVRPYRINCYYYEGLTEYYPNETGLTQQLFQSNRFNSGEIYYLSSFTKDSFASYKEDLETQQTLNGFAFYFNTENEILKDAKVRQALSVALDRNAIVTETTGTGEIAATGYVPNGVFNTDRKTDFRTEGGNLYNTSSDMAKAKELAKGKKGTLTVTYLVPTNDYTVKNYGKKIDYTSIYETIAKKAGEYWKSLGFTIKYKGLNPDDYAKALKTRDYDIIGVNVISGSADALNYLAPFAKEYSGTSVVVDNSVANADEVFSTHYTNIDNKDYSALIETAYKAKNLADRAKALHDAEAKLVELCPATMVFWYTYSYVASDEISGYESDSWFGYVNMIDLKLSDWRDVNSKEAEVLEARDPKNK